MLPGKDIRLSFVCPYYNNETAMDRQLRTWEAYPDAMRRQICFIVVDDCSANPRDLRLNVPLNLVHLRILTDIPWNQPGAKNLGYKFALTEWVFSTDIDHIVTEDACRKMLEIPKEPETVYFFLRDNEDGSVRHPHPNSFLIERKNFLKAGGYDEDFCGHYGYDDILFRKLLESLYSVQQAESVTLVRWRDARTQGLNRSAWQNRRRIKKRSRLFKKGKYRNGRILRFDWEIASARLFSEG